MTPTPRKASAAPQPACIYPIGASTCGQPASQQLPVGFASNAEPMPLCDLHAARFLGATQAIK